MIKESKSAAILAEKLKTTENIYEESSLPVDIKWLLGKKLFKQFSYKFKLLTLQNFRTIIFKIA